MYNYQGMAIHALYAERKAYDTYPSCQRDYVWSRGMQQKLIDSVLRGLPVPPITILPALQHTIMGTRFWVVDGQQRLKTILRFRDNEFKTAKSFSLEPGQKPFEPDRYYDEMTPGAQDAFNFYSLQMCFIQNVDTKDTGLIYRRFNYQVALKFAEVLYSYDSRAKQIVESLYGHSFWKTVYNGNRDRKQVFIMGIHIVYMEVMDIFANMTSPQLVEMARGIKDNKLTPQLADKISTTLDGLQNLFYGATISSTGEIIPIYQAGMLLENDGYDLNRSKRGCLAPWYMKFREQALSSRKKGTSNPIGVLTNVNRQREFWVNNLPLVYKAGEDALFIKDKKREFSELDKIIAWNRQEGKCPVCGKAVRVTDVGHHAQPHAFGGKTDENNAVLMHKECHIALHTNPQQTVMAE
jgi:hypothetical protein